MSNAESMHTRTSPIARVLFLGSALLLCASAPAHAGFFFGVAGGGGGDFENGRGGLVAAEVGAVVAKRRFRASGYFEFQDKPGTYFGVSDVGSRIYRAGARAVLVPFPEWRLRPYVGGGVHYIRTDWDEHVLESRGGRRFEGISGGGSGLGILGLAGAELGVWSHVSLFSELVVGRSLLLGTKAQRSPDPEDPPQPLGGLAGTRWSEISGRVGIRIDF